MIAEILKFCGITGIPMIRDVCDITNAVVTERFAGDGFCKQMESAVGTKAANLIVCFGDVPIGNALINVISDIVA